MKLQQRIHILADLGHYHSADSEAWKAAKEKASFENSWFLPEFINTAVNHICSAFLDQENLEAWVRGYAVPELQESPKTVESSWPVTFP